MPCGTKMAAKRVGGIAAVLVRGVCAGIMESSRGSASATPVPRRTARRDKCFLLMIPNLAGSDIFVSIGEPFHVHLELFALDDAEHQRGEVVFIPVSYTHLRAHETGRNLVC